MCSSRLVDRKLRVKMSALYLDFFSLRCSSFPVTSKMCISRNGKCTKIYINLEYVDISFTLLLKHIIKLHFQDFVTPFSLETAHIVERLKGTVPVQFSHSVVSNSLRPHESQHSRPPCPSPTPGVHSDSRSSSQ